MKYFKLKFLLMFFALAMAIPPAWAGTATYTVEFDYSAEKSEPAFNSSTKLSDFITEGIDYISDFSYSGNVYGRNRTSISDECIKIGKSGGSGSITLNLANSVKPTSISINARAYNATKAVDISINNNVVASQLTDVTFRDYTLSMNGTTSINSITISSSIYCYVASLTVTYETGGDPTPGKTDVTTFSFPQSSYTATLGESFTAPELSVDPAAAISAVTYSSSNTAVATVASDGTVTPVAAGTTTITASISNNATYNDANASYTLTVEAGSQPGGVEYELLTNLNQLQNGKKVIIANSKASGSQKAMGLQQNNNFSETDVTITSGLTITAPSADVQILTLEGTTGAWYFKTSDNEYLYAASSTKNYLKTEVTPDNDNNAKAAIVLGSDGNSVITFQGSNTNNLLRYNSGSKLFSCYASGQQPVYLYVESGGSATERVATPTFDPAGGNYDTPQSVTISCATDDATIYYTLDGSDPDANSAVYSTPLTVSATTTIKAIAMMDGWNNSAIASATYTINKPKIYNKVTHESQLIAGKKYILVYEDTPAFLGGISTTSTNYGIPVTGPTLEDNSVNIGQYSDIRELTLSGSSGEWLFHNGDGYLTWTGGNSLTVVSTPTTDSNQSKWTVSSTKNGYVLKSAVNNDRVLQYNSNDPRFACYTSAMKPVVLYVEDGVEPKPYVMADPTSLDFEAVIGQDPVTETFTVMAENLKGDITLTMSESDVFTITPATIPKADMTEEGVVVTVTYNPTAVTGEDFDKATVTIKSTDADDVKVNLTGMATLPDPELTVSPETLEMGTEPTRTFTVTGQHLTENVTLTVTEGEAKNFEISHATITPDEEGKVSQEVTVTYKGNSTEDEYATITVKSGIAKKEVIVTARVLPTPEIIAEPENLTMTAVVGQTPATATFTVMASDLRGDITLTMSESDVFTIEPATIRKADMTEDGVEVTVTYTPIKAGDDNATITIASEAAESATVTLNGTATVPEVVAMPTFSLVAGSYTGVQTVIISCATEGATISYSTDGGQTWTEGNTVNVDKDMTIMAKASRAGYTISETATAAYIIDIPEELPTITPFKGYYQIKNNGNGMYANIAGRKTLNFTDAPADKAGTVIWLETNDKGQVQSIRSQAADLQGYANRAMRYVPEIVELVADKLNADGEGNLLGETGLKKIMEKFNESFDHHLYVEQAGEGWRLYGKTPSMQPVVDFYRENTAQVEAKLPMLESFINSALNKLKEKIGGQSVFTEFKLLDIWEKMGGTLTKPVDEASIMAFYREVLNNKNYVWDFAYQTAMIYVNNLTSHDRWSEVEEYLGEYAQYINKIDQIRPDFKYYVVQENDKPDFISEGNVDIKNNAARTIWTLEPRTDFTVNIPANAETICDKFQKATTLYTDFAYELPEGVTAYKVTDVVEGTAITEALSGVIPAQTPVLLMAAEAGDKVLTLSTEAGTAVTSNLLVGPDYLINTYKLTTPQVEGIFNMIKEKLGEDFYNTYVKEYEHLMYLNSGTVNNKYFWGLKEEDVKKCTYLDEEGVKDYVVRGLEGNAFVNNKQVKTNKAFLVSKDAQIISLNKRGDVNHDGKVNIKDVTDLIDRLLDPENTAACPICSDFNLSGKVDIKDVTDLIDVLLTAPYAEQEQPSTGSQD